MVGHRWSHSERVWKGGALAGLAGGVSMVALTMITAATQGHDVWLALKIPAAPFLGETVFRNGFAWGSILVGMLVHSAVSIAWGVLFALLALGLSRGRTVAGGAMWGGLVWLATIYLVFPMLRMGDLIRSIPLGFAAVEHLLFGLTVGTVFLAFQKTDDRRLSALPVLGGAGSAK